MNGISTLLDVIFRPSDAFNNLRQKPYILVILLCTIAVTAATTYIIMGRMDPSVVRTEVRDQIESFRDRIEKQTGKEMTEEDIDGMVEKRMQFMGKMRWIATATTPIAATVVFLILALLYFLIFKLLLAEVSFRHSLSLVLHGYIPHLVKAILAVIIAMLRQDLGMMEAQNLVASNPAFLVDPIKQKWLYSLLTSIDAFNIWVVILLTIGFTRFSDKKRSTALAWILGMWGLWILLKVGGALLFGGMGG